MPMNSRYSQSMISTTTSPLLRVELGAVLRQLRNARGWTLREVAQESQVALGYLSEIERGRKEASSELLNAICDALGVPLWFVLREVSDRMAILDGTVAPERVSEPAVPVTLIS